MRSKIVHGLSSSVMQTRKRRVCRNLSFIVRSYVDISCGVELWHVFHDELDLDGNGHLDAEELVMALSHAGRYPFATLTANPLINKKNHFQE